MDAHKLHDNRDKKKDRAAKAAACPLTQKKKRQLAQSKIDAKAMIEKEKKESDQSAAEVKKIKADIQKAKSEVAKKRQSEKSKKSKKKD